MPKDELLLSVAVHKACNSMHRLYGVTMQERGVSRLLSVDLGRAIELAETSLL
jgi:hypothetical protein